MTASADARLQLIFAAKNLASGEMNRLHGGLLKLQRGMGGLSKGARGLAGDVGHLTKVGLLGAVGALAALAGAVGFATKQAADEQVGIVRLNTALKDNVKGFKGSTVEIEKRIAAQEKLGFSDDAQRDSLAALVVKTKNVAKAQQLQAIAMDLARARGIDLATATDTLIKIQNGQYRALKGLGIAIVPVTTNYDKLVKANKHATDEQKKQAKALDDAATKAKALAAIQKATTGQAKAYGDTQAGIGDAIRITFMDVVEDLGGIFLPMVKTASLVLRDTIVPAIRDVVTNVSGWVKANQPLIASIGEFVHGALRVAIAGVSAFVGAIIAALPTIISIGRTVFNYVVPKVQAFATTLTKPGGVIDSVGGVVGPILKNLIPAFGKVVEALFGDGGLVPRLGDLVGVLWGGGKGPLAIALGAAGGLLTGFMDILSSVAKFCADVVDGITGIIDAVNNLLSTTNRGFKVGHLHGSEIAAASSANDHKKGRARGGPTWPGIPFTYGETGSRESWMMPSGRGYVIPDGGAQARARGGGGGLVPIEIPVMLDGREVGRIRDKALYYDLARAAPTLVRS